MWLGIKLFLHVYTSGIRKLCLYALHMLHSSSPLALTLKSNCINCVIGEEMDDRTSWKNQHASAIVRAMQEEMQLLLWWSSWYQCTVLFVECLMFSLSCNWLIQKRSSTRKLKGGYSAALHSRVRHSAVNESIPLPWLCNGSRKVIQLNGLVKL